MLSTLLDKFSRRQTDDMFFFLIFPRKQDLMFHANFPRKQDLTFHARDNLNEMSNPVFWEK